MYLVRQTTQNNHYHSLHKRSERGFVLIAALMAVMILMAVGFFILTTTSQDIKISSRLVGERKALSAAESGLQQLCVNFDPYSPGLLNQSVDATNDPTARFDIGAATWNREMSEMFATAYSETMGYAIFDNIITGRDASYQSEVQLSVGVKFGPVPAGTEYK